MSGQSIVVNDPILEATDLVHSYGQTRALRGLSLSVRRGEMLAISGPSGSGKSTLMLCLAGVLTPISGTITYDGIAIERADDRTRSRLRRTDFGIVFQFGQLVPELSSVENVMLPLLLEGARRRDARDAAMSWLQRLDVEQCAGVSPSETSGGQQQRIAISRAMVTSPSIIFADEPTGALDQLAGERAMSHLSRVARETGTTVLLVTHDPRIAAYADREVVVRDGRVDQLELAP